MIEDSSNKINFAYEKVLITFIMSSLYDSHISVSIMELGLLGSKIKKLY